MGIVGGGRVPVSVDTTQTEFDTVEETGGAKTHTLTETEMPSHQHFSGLYQVADRFGSGGRDAAGTYSGYGGAVYTSSTGGSGAHNNLQPYITCYMWKRTA